MPFEQESPAVSLLPRPGQLWIRTLGVGKEVTVGIISVGSGEVSISQGNNCLSVKRDKFRAPEFRLAESPEE